jgi:hypothetical protein
MNYQYKITWTQPYIGWQAWQLQEIEKQLEYSNLAEAKLIIAKIMSL